MTTVAQLIEFLQKQPQDAVVLFQAWSAENLLDLDQIRVRPKEGWDEITKRVFNEKLNQWFGCDSKRRYYYGIHNGMGMNIDEDWVPSRNVLVKPEAVDAVIFPGN